MTERELSRVSVVASGGRSPKASSSVRQPSSKASRAVRSKRTGGFTPHKWAGFASAAFAGAALLVYLIGLVAEMLDRMRVAQDELVYRVRRLESALRDK
mgnify:CR=1 FL=1